MYTYYKMKPYFKLLKKCCKEERRGKEQRRDQKRKDVERGEKRKEE